MMPSKTCQKKNRFLPQRLLLFLAAGGVFVRGWVVPQVASHRRSQPFSTRDIQNNPLFPTHQPLPATSESTEEVSQEFKPSFYQTLELNPRGKPIWKERKQLSELKVGDRLEGYVVQEHLDGQTGPKLFLECGVGRYNSQKQAWNMVNAMLRLGRRGTKASVTKKRVARLKKRTSIECFVSCIRLASGQLEMVLNSEQVPDADEPKQVSVSSLKPGTEVVGTVQKLVPFGAFVDVGCNRNGLLHIQKVADLMGSYIDKEEGLKEAGLEPGGKIKVQVESNEKKRIFLDFTPEVKEEAEKERLERQKSKEERRKAKEERQQKQSKEDDSSSAAAVATAGAAVASGAAVVATASSGAVGTSTDTDAYQEEADAWAAYAVEYQNDSGVDEDEDDDERYDEDRDIEDALGLGTY